MFIGHSGTMLTTLDKSGDYMGELDVVAQFIGVFDKSNNYKITTRVVAQFIGLLKQVYYV